MWDEVKISESVCGISSLHLIFLIKNFFFIGVWLIYNVVFQVYRCVFQVYSKVIHTHVFTLL